jgi:hypothetical protein
MQVRHTRWRTYHTPHIAFIPNEEYYQISFVVFNHHWWFIINRKKEIKLSSLKSQKL